MRAVFLGTPAAAIPALAALVDVADVALVVTRPDAPRGRSKHPEPPPVKQAAREWGLRLAQPSTHVELSRVLEGARCDVGVVVAYGRILRPEALAATRAGFVNVHFSLLPRWRGAAPVERAIIAGDDATGVSLMLLDEGLDTGPVIAVAETDIDPDETAGGLGARLAYLGGDLLAGVLPEFMAGQRLPAPQIDAGAVAADPLTTAEAALDPGDDAATTLRKIRGYNPRPGAWLVVGSVRVKVWEAAAAPTAPAPGSLVAVDGAPVLGVADGGIRLEVVQPAGKRSMAGADWLRGMHGEIGDVEFAV
jgi:methionyl-tRNA formyltransferase